MSPEHRRGDRGVCKQVERRHDRIAPRPVRPLEARSDPPEPIERARVCDGREHDREGGVVEDAREGPQNGEEPDHGDALHDDRPVRRAIALVHALRAGEEQAVERHGVSDAGPDEDHRIQGAENRDEDEGRDDRARDRAEESSGRGLADIHRPAEGRHRHGVDIDRVNQPVDEGADAEAKEQRPGHGAAGAPDLARHVHRGVPPEIGEEHRREREAEGGGVERRATREQGPEVLDPPPAKGGPGDDERAQRRHLAVRRHVVEAHAGADADVVHRGHHGGDRDGGEHLAGGAETHEMDETFREAGGKGGDRAGVDHEEGEPSDHEPRGRVVGLAQVDVVAAGVRVHRPELGIGERARRGEEAAGEPGGEDGARVREEVGDATGRQEDPRSDHRRDDEHRGVVE